MCVYVLCCALLCCVVLCCVVLCCVVLVSEVPCVRGEIVTGCSLLTLDVFSLCLMLYGVYDILNHHL